MATCNRCQKRHPTIAAAIGYCASCLREHWAELQPLIDEVHAASRRRYRLPPAPPREPGGWGCGLCQHRCIIPEGGLGFCGERRVQGGRLRGGRPHEGRFTAYHDPLPCNCVSSFLCAGCTGAGFPRYAVKDGPEYGWRNLAVFYHACSFNCLFCQNYHFKEQRRNYYQPARAVAAAVDRTTSCICYFGGDPTPQVLHAIKAAKLARRRAGTRVLRICWESNGAALSPYIEMMAALSLESGGCVKLDLKAWSTPIHRALCGVDNEVTLKNVRLLAELGRCRPEPPLLVASTLLVPGYVDVAEVQPLAAYLAGIDPDIPYSLLAFHPCHLLADLPATSRGHAERCIQAAKAAGLRRIHLGNRHLLGRDYD